MVANPTESLIDNAAKVTYPVLLESVAGGWIATIPGWAEGKAIGETREAALERLQQVVKQKLPNGYGPQELTQLEVELSAKPEHPWMKFAGMFENDPYFDEMLEHIEEFRRVDREEYFCELDAEAAALQTENPVEQETAA